VGASAVEADFIILSDAISIAITKSCSPWAPRDVFMTFLYSPFLYLLFGGATFCRLKLAEFPVMMCHVSIFKRVFFRRTFVDFCDHLSMSC